MQVSPRCRCCCCCWNRARPDVTFPPSVKRRWLAASPSTLLFPSLSLPALTTATTPMMGREKTPLFHCMLILSMKSSLSRVVCGQQSGKYGLGLFPCEARMRQSLSLFLSTTHSVRPVEWGPGHRSLCPDVYLRLWLSSSPATPTAKPACARTRAQRRDLCPPDIEPLETVQ